MDADLQRHPRRENHSSLIATIAPLLGEHIQRRLTVIRRVKSVFLLSERIMNRMRR